MTWSMTIKFRMREVVPYSRCGSRNRSANTPSSATRFNTPFEPTSDVLTAPARMVSRLERRNHGRRVWQSWAGQKHRQTADQVIEVLRPLRVSDQHTAKNATEPVNKAYTSITMAWSAEDSRAWVPSSRGKPAPAFRIRNVWQCGSSHPPHRGTKVQVLLHRYRPALTPLIGPVRT